MSYRIHGLTLLEVMLALFFSLFLTAILTHLFLRQHKNYLQQQEYLMVAASAHKVLTLLQDEIRMAGQVGCAKLTEDFVVWPYHEFSLTLKNRLVITENDLRVRYQSFPAAYVKHKNGRNSLISMSDVHFQKDQLLIVSDCAHAEIIQAKSVRLSGDSQIITTTEPLRFDYQAGAEIGHMVARHYFVARDLLREEQGGRRNTVQHNIQHLQFQQDAHGIHYSFQTTFHDALENWYGYAATE